MVIVKLCWVNLMGPHQSPFQWKRGATYCNPRLPKSSSDTKQHCFGANLEPPTKVSKKIKRILSISYSCFSVCIFLAYLLTSGVENSHDFGGHLNM